MTKLSQCSIHMVCEYCIMIVFKTKSTTPLSLVWKKDRYLHDCHTDTDSQNNSTVVQKPFLHTGYTALEEPTERARLRETWKEGGFRPAPRRDEWLRDPSRT